MLHITRAQMIFRSSDDLKLYRKLNGTYLVNNEREFLSIVGCIIIDQHSHVKEDRTAATFLLNSLKRNKVVSIETGKPITVKW